MSGGLNEGSGGPTKSAMGNPRQYTDPQRHRDYSIFNEDYFSGADARIYFGDIWIDEVFNIQLSLQEQVTPIYGYHSYTYDAVMRGARQVQGQFQINFKEVSYLHTVMKELESRWDELKERNQLLTSYDNITQNVTPEHILNTAQEGHTDAFDNMASQFEKSFWGDAETGVNRATRQRSNNSYFAPSQAPDGHAQPHLNEHGFNIVLLYGPYTQVDGTEVSRTAQTIVGVHLTGVAQQVDASGEPIRETYSFIAKDLSGDLTGSGERDLTTGADMSEDNTIRDNLYAGINGLETSKMFETSVANQNILDKLGADDTLNEPWTGSYGDADGYQTNKLRSFKP